MKIRSLTLFAETGSPPNRLLLDHLGIFARHARALFTQAGFALETVRLAVPPFPKAYGLKDIVSLAQQLSIETSAVGVDYLSLGPALPETPEAYTLIPEVLANTQNVFMTGLVTTANHELDLNAARACAQVIEQLSKIEPNGFGNLYFSALANVKPYCPFFPTAFAEFGRPAFALAMEGASLALESFRQAESLAQARDELIRRVQAQASKLEEICFKLESAYQYAFKGLDFTLAPHPDASASIGKALEALGLPAFGLAGSITASAFLTDTLDRALYKRTGFNGLMLPVLEDSTLAERSRQGLLDLQSLLLCSAVCGTGLDVVPLPGNAGADQIYPIILDVAALALRLDKQLTARLMPIPDKNAGENTSFRFDYFANGGLLPLRSQGLQGLLASQSRMDLKKRSPQA
ncbi:MAG: DUF711 family protein [Anaerolineaceae bacterium]|nr:DUF711 family protein [Anaerolineaceae bacterium]